MSEFLTTKSRIGQTSIEGYWYTLDNQLYKDYDGCIYLTPRNTFTDGYTIPAIFHLIAGDNFNHDLRACTQHDYECVYHKALKVNLSIFQLRQMELLRYKGNMTICEDIPLEYIEIVDTSFNDTNARFRRMLDCLENMSEWQKVIIGNAVNFNLMWLFSKRELHTDLIYKFDYEQLIKGF